MTFTGIMEARAMLDRLAQGLLEAAGGAVLARATTKVKAQVDAIAKRASGAHVASGTALSSVLVASPPGTVALSNVGYLRYHSWWPFRRGMPASVVQRASIILARELMAALGGKGGGQAGSEALAIIEEVNVAKRASEDRAVERNRAKFKRDIAKIFRRSTAGKAARKAAAKERSLIRKTGHGGEKGRSLLKAARAARRASRG